MLPRWVLGTKGLEKTGHRVLDESAPRALS